MSFCIVTACSRPENLDAILSSILAAEPPRDLLWVIYHDYACRKFDVPKLQHADVQIFHTSYFSGDGWGHAARNKWLETNTIGWTYFLDDDNVIHPEFFRGVEDHYGKKIMIFGQEISPGSFRHPNNQVCHVDLAQCVFHRECIGDLRFGLNYEADGQFIQDLTTRIAPGDFSMSQRICSYYNRLRW
jgi:hypothetical protein